MLKLGTCLKCKGDLLWEDDEWRCLQCARYHYSNSHLVLRTIPLGNGGRQADWLAGISTRWFKLRKRAMSVGARITG